uniref:Uncharacterized protein n=1 Tax=Glossina brevipalpis TaxID=37001 RepID=A0A1A9WKR7_9MUSC
MVISTCTAANNTHGLECYVCDTCDDLENFNHLQSCEEPLIIDIYSSTTTTPGNLLQTLENTTVNINNTKPSEEIEGSGEIGSDDFEYEDFKEKRRKPSNSDKNQSVGENPFFEKTTTTPSKPFIINEDNIIEYKETVRKPLIIEKNIWENDDLEYEENNFVNNEKEHFTEISKTFTTPFVASIKSKMKADIKNQQISEIIFDYNSKEDYLDNEEHTLTMPDIKFNNLKSVSQESFSDSVAVCYLIKMTINNTLITKRGCSNLINASNQLTCQSLHNDAPLEICHICDTNACNKFLIANDDENLENALNIAAVSINSSMMLFSIFIIIVSSSL